MQYSFRLAVTWLLTLTLSLSMFADVSMTKRCHMRAMGGVQMMAKNCCDPAKAAKFVNKMQLCKLGQHCNNPSSCTPSALAMITGYLDAVGSLPTGWKAPIVSPLLVDSLWRPPRFLS